MEYLPQEPQSPESPILSFHEAKTAMEQLSYDLAMDYPNVRLGLEVCSVKEGFGVALRVQEEDKLEFARVVTEIYIPGVPVDIQLTGPIRTAARMYEAVRQADASDLITHPEKTRAEDN